MTCAVAVALYNGTRFLEKQLDSLRLQTKQPDQVILCDDKSRDGTAAFVRNYIEKYNLSAAWTLYENEENLGYVRNFYKAISLCTTDLIFLSDQDDIWKPDKIRKMSDIMAQKDEITLLSCKYGIIDADDKQQHSLVEPAAQENEGVHPITTEEIMRAYRWPGMLMCLRREFFRALHPHLNDCKAAHDLVFAVCAADNDGFYEYNYVGAYHRRHDNNTAKEEHRVRKLLNRQRKLSDIASTKKTWTELLSAPLPLREENTGLIRQRLDLMTQREKALQEKSLKQILALYRKNKQLLRFKSLVCDLWLVCFAK